MLDCLYSGWLHTDVPHPASHPLPRSLAGCQITDVGLATLCSVKASRLEWLDISLCKALTSKGLRVLRALTNLRCLRAVFLDGDTDGVLERIARSLPALTSLAVHCNFPDADNGAPNVGLPAMLRSLAILSAGTATLACLINLQSLEMYGGDCLSDAAVGDLSTLTALTQLKLRGADFTGVGIGVLTALRCLELDNCRGARDSGFSALRRLPFLCKLTFDDCDGFPSNGLAALPPSLTKLHILGRYAIIEDSTLKAVARLTLLRDLRLGSRNGWDVGPDALSHLASLTALTSLALEGYCARPAGMVLHEVPTDAYARALLCGPPEAMGPFDAADSAKAAIITQVTNASLVHLREMTVERLALTGWLFGWLPH